MSQESVKIVRSIHEAFNRRDWNAAFRDQSLRYGKVVSMRMFAKPEEALEAAGLRE